ncbi:hypothetical protein E0765_07475 [Sulfuricurvum sp. IAE1]|uniref:hypothetical protein n=1 Tax=Sulfuricurvum sp. IAE1 TaxID=2546102 RepID=UPI001051A6CD|nr:hypothetical protein [Sulfuricurvum sp. IAE1]TDA63667.1 hypothetical protein E0765_07475 [Sulfuricurvum sp. IAE1]
MDKNRNGMTWQEWFGILETFANGHGMTIHDEEAWKEEWEAGKDPIDSFLDECPEYEDVDL